MDNNKIIILLLIIIIALLVAGIVILNPFATKTDTMISVTSANEVNEGDELSILLTDINSTPIAGQLVYINITDSGGIVTQKTVITSGEGVGVVSLDGLASGQYSVNVTYGGNDTFEGSNTSQNLNIKHPVAEVVESTESTSSQPILYSDFVPSYTDGPLIYGYRGNRFGFITPSGLFHEM